MRAGSIRHFLSKLGGMQMDSMGHHTVDHLALMNYQKMYKRIGRVLKLTVFVRNLEIYRKIVFVRIIVSES